MPRASDPSLIGQQLPITHSPLSRIDYRFTKPETSVADLMEGAKKFVEDYLFPVIEELTGIDLSAFLPLLDALNLDFSSPTAFFQSLINAILLLPEIVLLFLNTLVEQLVDAPETFAVMVSGLITLLVTLPTMLTELGNALLTSAAGMLGIESPLNSLNLFNLVPTDIMSHIPMSNIGEFVTNMLTDPDFLDTSSIPGWLHDLTGGFGGTGTRYTTANSTLKELFGNLIPVSQGQTVPVSTKAKWAGLLGTGNPIQLAVTGYKNGAATLQQTIASHNTTPPTTDWVTLAGDFTVPTNVDSLRTRLVVTSTASSGTVYFSKSSVTKIGTMLQRLVSGTDPGTTITNDIEGLFAGTVSNAVEILDRVKNGDFEGLVSTLTGDIQSGFEDVGDRLESFLDHLSPLNGSNINTGQIADQFIPAVGDIFDTTVTNVQNVVGSGFTIESVAQALAAQTHALVDAGSGISSLFSRLGNLESRVAAIPPPTAPATPGKAFGGAIGIIDSDDFERVSSSSLGANWITSYSGGSGTWATPNGHDAAFATSGINDRDFLSIRSSTTPRSATDYQRVTTVVSAAATRYYDLLLGTFNYVGHNDIWLRVGDASTSLANVTGTRLRFGGDGSVSLVRFVNGSGTTVQSRGPGSITPPGPGAQLIGEAGNVAGAGTPLYFRGIIGVSTRIEATDLGASVGSTFRRWGHGGRAEGHLLPLPGQEKPASLHYWTGMDQLTS